MLWKRMHAWFFLLFRCLWIWASVLVWECFGLHVFSGAIGFGMILAWQGMSAGHASHVRVDKRNPSPFMSASAPLGFCPLHLRIHNICSSFWQQNNQSKRNQVIIRSVILLMVTVVYCQVSLWKCGILHALQCALPFSKAQICFLTFYYAIPDKNSNLSPLTWLRTAYMYMDIFVQDNNVMFHFPLPTN